MAIKKKITQGNVTKKAKRVRKDTSADAIKRRKAARQEYRKNKTKIRTDRKKAERSMTESQRRLKKERAFVLRLQRKGYSQGQINAKLKDFRAKIKGQPTEGQKKRAQAKDVRAAFNAKRKMIQEKMAKLRADFKASREKNKNLAPAKRKAANAKAKASYMSKKAALNSQRQKLAAQRKSTLAKYKVEPVGKPAGTPAAKGTRIASQPSEKKIERRRSKA